MAGRKFSYTDEYGEKREFQYESAKKSSIGNGYTPVKHGEENFDFIVMTTDTLDLVKGYISELRNQIDDIKRNDARIFKKQESDHKKEIEDLNRKHEADKAEAMSDVNKKLFYCEEKLIKEEQANYGLRKAARERANRARKIDKKSSGYIILEQSNYRYKWIQKDGTKTIEKHPVLYRMRFQTPLSSDIDIQYVDHEVTRDLESAVLDLEPDLDYHWAVDYQRSLNEALENKKENTATIYTREYRCDYKKGFWEVTFITSFPYKPTSVDDEDKTGKPHSTADAGNVATYSYDTSDDTSGSAFEVIDPEDNPYGIKETY